MSNTPSNDPARLDALETTAAYQQQVIDDLSDALAEQWRGIETLRRQIDRLTDRLAQLEPAASEAAPADRPPHW